MKLVDVIVEGIVDLGLMNEKKIRARMKALAKVNPRLNIDLTEEQVVEGRKAIQSDPDKFKRWLIEGERKVDAKIGIFLSDN
ncbi:MAG: hypothetical protein JRJ85_23005 [Deltaproteobacteria bacterium]|nr:hypothetical protein [Deltaproteobacteria bacterium]